jgi:hypothetical protein
VLKLDAHGFSPALIEKILLMAGRADSFDAAAEALRSVGEISISARTVNQLSAQLGGELAEQRDRRTQSYQDRPLPRVPTKVDPAPCLAAVFCDGGRMRTRTAGGGHGIYQPHWRETKNAAFHRMLSQSYDHDPQPDLPDCFRNQAYVEKLVSGLKKAKTPEPELISPSAEGPTSMAPESVKEPAAWQPRTLVRTCVSSLCSSEEFGPKMAAEADSRGFFAAEKRAFLGDGQKYNWSIQQRWFPGFTAVADFIHVVEYVYDAAKVLYEGPAERWKQYVAWAGLCWEGKVTVVIDELSQYLSDQPLPATGDCETGRSEAVQRTLTYLTNNRSRMDYPRYRREGLPVTSSLAESLVKQISKRVKGTEKFWDDGPRGEAILQIRAACISQDNRLSRFVRNRPISPHSPRCRLRPPPAAP